MNWNNCIRQVHRWTSLVFAVVVSAIFATLGIGRQPAEWVYFLPLFPLAVLLAPASTCSCCPISADGARSARSGRHGRQDNQKADKAIGEADRHQTGRCGSGRVRRSPTAVRRHTQIAKGHGDAPVQAYIAAMPGWKSDVGRRLNTLIERAVPGVCRAVKWNSPLYGLEGEGFFLGIHVFTKYIKVAFFRGVLLHPVPPGQSKQKDVRYLDIRENDDINEEQFADWVRQASQLPGERM